MSEVKYVAISEELRGELAKYFGEMVSDPKTYRFFRELEDAPQVEVKRHLRTRIDLAGAVAVNFKLPIA